MSEFRDQGRGVSAPPILPQNFFQDLPTSQTLPGPFKASQAPTAQKLHPSHFTSQDLSRPPRPLPASQKRGPMKNCSCVLFEIAASLKPLRALQGLPKPLKASQTCPGAGVPQKRGSRWAIKKGGLGGPFREYRVGRLRIPAGCIKNWFHEETCAGPTMDMPNPHVHVMPHTPMVRHLPPSQRPYETECSFPETYSRVSRATFSLRTLWWMIFRASTVPLDSTCCTVLL